jgi:hypothetical protein
MALLLLIGFGMGFGMLFYAGYVMTQSVRTIHQDPDAGEVRLCLVDRHDAEQVSCADPSARYMVLGRVERITRDGFDTSWRAVCHEWPEADNARWAPRAWSEDHQGTGNVLCLQHIPGRPS